MDCDGCYLSRIAVDPIDKSYHHAGCFFVDSRHVKAAAQITVTLVVEPLKRTARAAEEEGVMVMSTSVGERLGALRAVGATVVVTFGACVGVVVRAKLGS